MSTADDVFMRQFGLVLGLLVIFAFVVYFIADGVGDESLDRVMKAPSAVEARISPTGTVVVEPPAADQAAAAPAAPAAAAPVAAAPAAAAPAAAPAAPAPAAVAAAPAEESSKFNGQEIYMSSCSACHVSGAAGAPKLTDAAAWGERAKAGLDALYTNALKGKGAMPPKGGRVDLEDGAIKAAVRHMLKEAGVTAG